MVTKDTDTRACAPWCPCAPLGLIHGSEASLPPLMHTFSLPCLLLSGDLKDGKTKADKKDHSSTGNDSKKTDGKSAILITISIECATAADVLALCSE